MKLDVLSLPEFVQKTSLNPARMLRLKNKGHLSVGADADITVYDYATQTPKASFVAGQRFFSTENSAQKAPRSFAPNAVKRPLKHAA